MSGLKKAFAGALCAVLGLSPALFAAEETPHSAGQEPAPLILVPSPELTRGLDASVLSGVAGFKKGFSPPITEVPRRLAPQAPLPALGAVLPAGRAARAQAVVVRAAAGLRSAAGLAARLAALRPSRALSLAGSSAAFEAAYDGKKTAPSDASAAGADDAGSSAARAGGLKPYRRLSAFGFAAAAVPAAAAVHPSVAWAALAAFAGPVSYWAANVLSFAFPFPVAYQAFSGKIAGRFPVLPAWLGGISAALLGVINAAVLNLPLWGAMHIFIGLGMIAPYFIIRWMERRPDAASSPALALKRTIMVGAALAALSAGLYFAAAAVVPAALAAVLPHAAVESLLLALQLLKLFVFMFVFAPEAAALLKGHAPKKSFGPWFNAIFFLSAFFWVVYGIVTAFTPGADMAHWLAHAARNFGECVAASLAFWAGRRAARRAP